MNLLNNTTMEVIKDGYTIPDGINLILGARYSISWSEPESEVTESCRYEGYTEINEQLHLVFTGVFSRYKILPVSELDNYEIGILHA